MNVTWISDMQELVINKITAYGLIFVIGTILSIWNTFQDD